MTQAEKIQKQTERNKRRIVKEKIRKINVWYNKAMKLIKRKINEASKDGDTHILIIGNDLWHLVSYDEYAKIGIEAIFTKLEETFRANGFEVEYTRYNSWGSSGRLDIDWSGKSKENNNE